MSNVGLALHTDKYQINMLYAHWMNKTMDRKAVFDVYFRKQPFGGGFAVFAGLERVIHYINELHFDEESLRYLAEQEENYDPRFLEELRHFRFNGSIHSVEEGEIVFAGEPIMRVEARMFEAQLIETALLNFVNFQTLIATKAARVRHVAKEDVLLEFGTRRAQEQDAAVWGARATYLAGFDATSNMLAGYRFGIPTKGTHAHSWVQDHDSEEEAFLRFAEALPDQVTLLVDTYDVLKSGVPNAIKTARELEKKGKRLKGIRLDSGDLAYLSIEARRMLDEAGLTDAKITASNDLDEDTIFEIKAQGAKIDIWGVGTKLITGGNQPALGGVYKLVAREKDGEFVPTIKISANPEKITNPGIKDIYRIVSKVSGRAEGDLITLAEGDVPDGSPVRLFNPTHTFIQKKVTDYEVIPLLKSIFRDGKQVYSIPPLEESRRFHSERLKLFWPQYLRRLNPEIYPVDLSRKAWDMKMQLIQEHME
ncbi:nicotinate phosphoribosyltransferase [Gorillibacterium timonense]|uniref:nicotinate phosphoribosyltransferase n=1 Tax=Gorillibacterium timonense TaxID=1689269 RepID=UPI00071E09BB|nr:nicotinate phosphoribosyltransferase [Gorillibacterium timonense]